MRIEEEEEEEEGVKEEEERTGGEQGPTVCGKTDHIVESE